MKTFLLFLPFIFLSTSMAFASSAPEHLVSWGAKLYDMAHSEHHTERLSEQERHIYTHAIAALEKADIVDWARTPVMLKTLEESQTLAITHQMELDKNTFLRIDWVEEHIGISIEHTAKPAYHFLLDGRVDITQKENNRVLLQVLAEAPLIVIQPLGNQ